MIDAESHPRGADTLGAGDSAIVGAVQPSYAPVAELLSAQLAADDAYSVQLAAYHHGELVVDLVVGSRAKPTSITGVFSVGKGVAAICVALLVQDGLLDLDQPVSHYWPEFAAGGKQAVTVRQLLSHQCGLVGLPGGFTLEELSTPTSAGAAARLAAAVPSWHPGSLHGYHALTIGFLVEELFHRASGTEIQQYYNSRIREVLAIDTYLGVPDEIESRYLPMLDATVSRAEQNALAEWPDARDLLSYRAFNANGPTAPNGETAHNPNNRSVRAHGNPAFACVSNAAGLAKLYAATLSPLAGFRILSPETVGAVSQTQVAGPDQITLDETAFGVLFMKSCPNFVYGSADAYGHYGAGGAYAYADPELDLAIAGVPYHAPHDYTGPDDRAIAVNRLVRTIARDLATAR